MTLNLRLKAMYQLKIHKNVGITFGTLSSLLVMNQLLKLLL